jgi:single-strand DNA-binding protein
VNSVILTGNVATDIELRELPEAKRVANFLLAVDRRRKEGGADFLRVTVWDHQADLCNRFLSKGRRIGVEGRLRSRTRDEGDGSKRHDVDVVAHNVEFLSPPPANSGVEVVPFEAAVAG